MVNLAELLLYYCEYCAAHYSLEEFLSHKTHKEKDSPVIDPLTITTSLPLWDCLQSDLDFNDPVKMVIWSKFSNMKKEIELIQNKQIGNISDFYKSALAQDIQTNKMKLSWLLKTLHHYGYLNREKHQYRNQTTFIYFLPDIDPEIYEKLTSQYNKCLENSHCKESKTITTSPPDSKIHCKESFTINHSTKPMPEVLTQEQLLVISYSELTPSQIKIYSEKNPVFKREYTRLKKEGLLKEKKSNTRT